MREVLAEPPSIVAIGGGTPMIPAALAALQEHRRSQAVRIAYLRCSNQVLHQRLTAQAGDRASLTGRGVVEEVPELVAMREPTYRALADATLDTGLLSIDEAVDQAMQQLM
jgi:shikimate kinase